MDKRPRSTLLFLSGVLTAGLIAVGFLVFAIGAKDSPAAIMNGTPTLMAPQPTTEAPAVEASRVHRAIHAIGAICDGEGTSNRTAQVRPHIETILDFARLFPNVRFHIDGEVGTTVSLLIVARDGVRTCAPELTGEINSALPMRFQLRDTSR